MIYSGIVKMYYHTGEKTMNTTVMLLSFASIALSLASLGCMVYVCIKMYDEKGILHTLFGFFCCQLYPFIWGWIHVSRLQIKDIMVFWSFIVVLSIILQVITQTMITSEFTNLLLDIENLE
jgi:hypothetical protein